MQPTSGGLDVTWKMTVGGGVAVFLVGATFWAGATYNRIDGMESELHVISTQMSQLGDLPILKMKVDTLEIEVTRLQTQRDRDKAANR